MKFIKWNSFHYLLIGSETVSFVFTESEVALTIKLKIVFPQVCVGGGEHAFPFNDCITIFSGLNLRLINWV